MDDDGVRLQLLDCTELNTDAVAPLPHIARDVCSIAVIVVVAPVSAKQPTAESFIANNASTDSLPAHAALDVPYLPAAAAEADAALASRDASSTSINPQSAYSDHPAHSSGRPNSGSRSGSGAATPQSHSGSDDPLGAGSVVGSVGKPAKGLVNAHTRRSRRGARTKVRGPIELSESESESENDERPRKAVFTLDDDE